MCWIDVKTGKEVPTIPRGSVYLDESTYPRALRLDLDPDGIHAHNQKTGQNYVRQPDGRWIDAKTGTCVPTIPRGSVYLDESTYPRTLRLDLDPDGIHSHDPKTGQNYVKIPCPEETSSTTGGVKTAAAPAAPANNLFQLSLGYNFMRTAQEDVKNLNGFQVSGFYNFNSWFALGGEFSGLYGSETETRQFMVGDMKKDFDVKTSLDRYFYLFGPQVTWHPCEHTRVFGHVLAGGVHDRNEVSFPDGSMRSSADAFALAVGVGVDVLVTRHFSVGPSFDYVPTAFSSPSGNWQNNWRVGVAAKVNF
jgi:opacity protein-like surface antigen